MGRRRSAAPLVVLLGALALPLVPTVGTAAPDVRLADPYVSYYQRGNLKFDGVQQVLLAHRRSYDRSDPALAWADADGRRAGLISPLNDFPQADGFDIWAVAAGPQSVLVAGVVQAGEEVRREPPRHVILTYDLTGALRRKWVVNPWHYHQIAVDRSGNVYAMGHRIDSRRAKHLIRKYSPDGVVEREFLPSRLFANGADASITDSRTGLNQFWIDGDRLLVYMAQREELFQFDLDGRLERRTSLRQPLTRFAREHDGVRADVVKLAGDGQDGSLLAEVRVWGEGQKRVSLFLVRLPPDGARPQTVESTDGIELGTSDVPLLGTSGGAVLFLNRYTATILRR